MRIQNTFTNKQRVLSSPAILARPALITYRLENSVENTFSSCSSKEAEVI